MRHAMTALGLVLGMATAAPMAAAQDPAPRRLPDGTILLPTVVIDDARVPLPSVTVLLPRKRSMHRLPELRRSFVPAIPRTPVPD
ncbi:MAG: hypothetical protein AAGH15_15610 [Myxococcota bacterium]